MKKIIISVTILLISFSIIFFNINSKEKKEKQNNNISIILETEEGNIETNTFPDKDFYEYSNIVCENTNNNITPTFNSETWKLNLSVEEERIDGNFNCVIYFKHTPRIASDYIVSKYTENNDEGLIRINQPATVQTPSLTEYRYSGSNDNVKNYVNFNNETWRIIGVFRADDGNGNIENRVKIIREESIGTYSWDTSESGVNEWMDIDGTTLQTGVGVNQWGESGSYEGADLMRLLNPGYESESVNNSLYWNRGSGACYYGYRNATTTCNFTNTGLTENAKQMIGNVKWYLGAVDQRGITTLEAYTQERGSVTGTIDTGITVTKTTNWIGKVALLYPSDYGYSSSECYEKTLLLGLIDGKNDYSQEKCKSANWLYTDKYPYQDLLNPTSEANSGVRRICPLGYECNGLAANILEDIRPSVYLSSSVKITSGTGKIDDMYNLSL